MLLSYHQIFSINGREEYGHQRTLRLTVHATKVYMFWINAANILQIRLQDKLTDGQIEQSLKPVFNSCLFEKHTTMGTEQMSTVSTLYFCFKLPQQYSIF